MISDVALGLRSEAEPEEASGARVGGARGSGSTGNVRGAGSFGGDPGPLGHSGRAPDDVEALPLERQVVELLSRGSPVTVILEHICEALSEAFDGVPCGIVQFGRGRFPQLFLGPRLPEGFRASVLREGVTQAQRDAFERGDFVLGDLFEPSKRRFGDLLGRDPTVRHVCSVPALGPGPERVVGVVSLFLPAGAAIEEYRDRLSRHEAISLVGSLLQYRHTRRALEQTRRIDAAVARASGFLTWRLSRDGRIRDADSLRAYAGLSAEEMQRTDWLMALHPGDRSRFLERARRVRDGRREETLDLRIRRADDVYRHHHVVLIPLYTDPGLPVRGLFVVAMDHHDQREAEILLHQVSDAKDKVLATLSHELRNPLAAVQAGIEVLRPALRPDDLVAQQALSIMERSVRTQVGLVNDVLDLVRIQAGEAVAGRELVDLSAVVEDATARFRSSARQKEVGLRLDLPVRALWVFGDRARLLQVVGVLTGNALRYTPPGGRVDVACVRSRGQVLLTVRDTGRGMRPDELPNVFDLFYGGRGDDQRDLGVGIGLALVQEIAREHGGRAWADSEGAGKGSVFSVELPSAETVSPGTVSHPAPGQEPSPGPSGQVFLVEDNEGFRILMAEVLKLQGWTVTAAVSAGDALRKARATRPPTAMLLDIGLPDGDGRDLLGDLRTLPGWGGVPACALTGWGERKDLESGRAVGFDLYLVKPPDTGELMDWLNRVSRYGARPQSSDA